MVRLGQKVIRNPVVIGITALFLGMGVGVWSQSVSRTSAPSVLSSVSSVAEVRQSGRHQNELTNPLLECAEISETISLGERLNLEEKVKELIDSYQKRGLVKRASVYFRDLNNGPWFGVNESEKFVPASLLKLPLAMSFYWRAEDEPDLMDRKIQYERGTEDFEAHQPYGPNTQLTSGAVYTIERLIEIMLAESSNEAALALAQIAGEAQIESIYRDFGIESPTMNRDHTIDVHTFASFFRILYNATYLDRNDSEQVLNILNKSTFKNGIAGGVPSNVKVAHKFGSREIQGDDLVTKQLHDCGIIYAEDTPYVLCVMTRGQDFEQLADVIKQISAVVYKEVDAR